MKRDLINYIILEEIDNFNINAYKTTKEKIVNKKKVMGLPKNEKDESKEVKDTRYKFGSFVIQPPKDLHEKSEEERKKLYIDIVEFLEVVKKSVDAINARGLGEVFMPRTNDRSLPVIRLIDDKENKYAAMYQQEDDNNDGIWEQGDFIYNLKAKNANVHTLVHEIGHKFYYEILKSKYAEEWKDYFDLRVHREKQEFITKYSMTNFREDFAETFAVFVLGDKTINDLYKENRVNKNTEIRQKILGKFKNIVSRNKKEINNVIRTQLREKEKSMKEKISKIKKFIKANKFKIKK